MARRLIFKGARRDSDDDSQRCYNQGTSYKGYKGDTAATGRELASDNPVLALKVAMETN